MNAWELPTTLTVNNISYPIRTDFRVILDIMIAMDDPDLFEPDAGEEEKQAVRAQVLLQILFEDYEGLPPEDYREAIEKALEFIDCGMSDGESKEKKPRLMDWEQDAPLIIPAVNKSIGKEIRSLPYMHWWTFIGAYMDIGDGLFSQVLYIRQKKARHKKLEKWEREFYSQNKSLIDIKRKLTEEERQQQEEWNKFFAEWGG